MKKPGKKNSKKQKDVPPNGGAEAIHKLRESEEKYRSLVENARVAICTIDLKGRLTYANAIFSEVIGYSIQELLGSPFKDFLHPKDKGKIIRLFLSIMLPYQLSWSSFSASFGRIFSANSAH